MPCWTYSTSRRDQQGCQHNLNAMLDLQHRQAGQAGLSGVKYTSVHMQGHCRAYQTMNIVNLNWTNNKLEGDQYVDRRTG